jgi:hypothetical protein
LPSSAGPAIRSPTSAFTPWGEKRRSGSQAEDELSAATAIEALSSNIPSLLPSPVKKEPVDSSEVSESEGEDGEDVRGVESEKPSRRGKKRSAKHEDAKKERLSKRRLKTPQQLEILETEYAITRFPNTAKRQAISVATGALTLHPAPQFSIRSLIPRIPPTTPFCRPHTARRPDLVPEQEGQGQVLRVFGAEVHGQA